MYFVDLFVVGGVLVGVIFGWFAAIGYVDFVRWWYPALFGFWVGDGRGCGCAQSGVAACHVGTGWMFGVGAYVQHHYGVWMRRVGDQLFVLIVG